MGTVIDLILIIWIFYEVYQIFRIKRVSEIRRKWNNERDYRLFKYHFLEMTAQTKENWFGLKYPQEKDYK